MNNQLLKANVYMIDIYFLIKVKNFMDVSA